VRLFAVTVGFAVFLIGGKRIWLGIAVALTLLLAGQMLSGL
jgi:hypothetical protein